MRAADDFDEIGKRLAQLADEQNRVALGCTCKRQYDPLENITWSIDGSCPVHGADIAMGFRPGVQRLDASDIVIDQLRRAGYRVGNGPDPVTGKCAG